MPRVNKGAIQAAKRATRAAKQKSDETKRGAVVPVRAKEAEIEAKVRFAVRRVKSIVMDFFDNWGEASALLHTYRKRMAISFSEDSRGYAAACDLVDGGSCELGEVHAVRYMMSRVPMYVFRMPPEFKDERASSARVEEAAFIGPRLVHRQFFSVSDAGVSRSDTLHAMPDSENEKAQRIAERAMGFARDTANRAHYSRFFSSVDAIAEGEFPATTDDSGYANKLLSDLFNFVDIDAGVVGKFGELPLYLRLTEVFAAVGAVDITNHCDFTRVIVETLLRKPVSDEVVARVVAGDRQVVVDMVRQGTLNYFIPPTDYPGRVPLLTKPLVVIPMMLEDSARLQLAALLFIVVICQRTFDFKHESLVCTADVWGNFHSMAFLYSPSDGSWHVAMDWTEKRARHILGSDRGTFECGVCFDVCRKSDWRVCPVYIEPICVGCHSDMVIRGGGHFVCPFCRVGATEGV